MTASISFDPAEKEALAAEISLSVLQRHDASVRGILCSASHVCLYQLREDTQQWNRLEVEGSLFLVQRMHQYLSHPPMLSYRIVVSNRKSLDNYVDDVIVGNKQLELNDQMIMYRNSRGFTIGMWFLQKEQADEYYSLLLRIVNGENFPLMQGEHPSHQNPYG